MLLHPLFAAGMAIRLALIAAITPAAAWQWYAPFMASVLADPAADPWGAFLRSGGDPLAFPYGTAMILALLPVQALAGWIAPAKAYLLSLLIFDLALLLLLRRLIAGTPDRHLLLLYWLSPIVVFATYWMGLNDLIPVTILLAAVAAIEHRSPLLAGSLTALAVSAKLSMLIALPILVIYLLHNKPLRRYLQPYAASAAVVLAALMLPQLLSADGRQMLFGNPEMGKVYDLAIAFGEIASIYVLPVAYLVTLYWIWRFKRLRFDLLISALAMSFLLVLMLTPAAPGWFLWLMPFLVWFQSRSDRISVILVLAFSLIYMLQTAITSPYAVPRLWDGEPLAAGFQGVSAHIVSLIQTLLAALGLVIGFRLYRQGVQFNEYYRLSRRPLVLGVAGDSGAGKDTLISALEGVFGVHSTVRLSGDDYHLWDRHRPIWQGMTHLNPRANDLSQFSNDVARISSGQAISLRHYDHGLGRLGKPQKLQSNDFVIVSGLHALFLSSLRSNYDLAIYLDTDDRLRKWLKLRRDVLERGHEPEKVLESIARREADAEKFVRPQRSVADLVFAVSSDRPPALTRDALAVTPRLRLGVTSRHSAPYEELARLLISFAGVSVETSIDERGGVQLLIDGDIKSQDVAYVAAKLLPQLSDLVDLDPQWQPGVLGLMQLIVLLEASVVLRNRTL